MSAVLPPRPLRRVLLAPAMVVLTALLLAATPFIVLAPMPPTPMAATLAVARSLVSPR